MTLSVCSVVGCDEIASTYDDMDNELCLDCYEHWLEEESISEDEEE